MHHLELLPLPFKGPKQGFGGKNCQNASGGGWVGGGEGLEDPEGYFQAVYGR